MTLDGIIITLGILTSAIALISTLYSIYKSMQRAEEESPDECEEIVEEDKQNRCVSCGTIIPEGRQICLECSEDGV